MGGLRNTVAADCEDESQGIIVCFHDERVKGPLPNQPSEPEAKMTYLKNTTLVDTISIHGWVATVEIAEDGLYHAVVEIPFTESSEATHFLNACDSHGAFGALAKLADKLYTAAGVMLYLNPWEDKTNEKVHEFGLLLASHSNDALRAA